MRGLQIVLLALSTLLVATVAGGGAFGASDR
jgi:hypothetical protein